MKMQKIEKKKEEREIEEKYINIEKNCKVREHCHYTGKYRGATHIICNLKYSVPIEIAIFFHNESNYAHHFKIKYHFILTIIL